jgi:hypothetical protein
MRPDIYPAIRAWAIAMFTAVLVSGCGRLGFDINNFEPSDGGGDGAPFINGDEDSDQFNDINDNCPFVANSDQRDDDGDGVGNVCDPSVAAHKIALFLPMNGTNPVNDIEGTWTQQPGAWQCNGGDGTINVPIAASEIWVGGTLLQSYNNLAQLAIFLRDSMTVAQFPYFEYYQPLSQVKLTTQNPTTDLDAGMSGISFPPGDFLYRLRISNPRPGPVFNTLRGIARFNNQTYTRQTSMAPDIRPLTSFDITCYNSKVNFNFIAVVSEQ